LGAISVYLQAVHLEARTRGYRFDQTKIRRVAATVLIPVSRGQVQHEWQHLMAKLRRRSPGSWRAYSKVKRPQVHPLFKRVAGPVEAWETF
jgi:hypothetical protein